ncbi:helix-turn-helix domain-containing protein [Methylocella sp.]|uniref:helix-turn-helix domain-containing protein n=1 Tax=Methylocella sp. TaxID=1978226 RepID=UPI003784ADE8
MAGARSSKNNIALTAPHVGVDGLRLLSVKELCELLNISRSKAYVEMAAGRLRCIKLGGSTRFRLADVEAYIERASADIAA